MPSVKDLIIGISLSTAVSLLLQEPFLRLADEKLRALSPTEKSAKLDMGTAYLECADKITVFRTHPPFPPVDGPARTTLQGAMLDGTCKIKSYSPFFRLDF